MDFANKENSQFLTLTTPGRAKRKSVLDVRTPLQDVKQTGTTVKSGVKRTPRVAAPPASLSPGKSVRRKIVPAKGGAFSVKQDEAVSQDTLIFKQVVRMLDASKQEYADKLEEHERYIVRLQQQIASLPDTQALQKQLPDTEAPLSDTQVPIPDAQAPVNHTQEPLPFPDIQVPLPDTQAPLPDTQAPVIDTQAPIPDTKAPLINTLAPIPDIQAPLPDTQAPRAPLHLSDPQAAQASLPLLQAPLLPGVSPRAADVSDNREPRDTSFRSPVVDLQPRAASLGSSGVGSYTSTHVQTDSKESHSFETQTDRAVPVDAGAQTSSAGRVFASTQADDQRGSDAHTQTDPCSSSAAQTQTCAVSCSGFDICTQTQGASCSVQTQTLFSHVADAAIPAETQTDITHVADPAIPAETQTDVELTRLSLVNVETNTDRTQVTSSATCVTPKKYTDEAVCTSPERLFAGRPSDMGLERISESELRGELEAATISNSLLRSEISQLRQAEEQLRKQLSEISDKLQLSEAQRQHAVMVSQEEAAESLKASESRLEAFSGEVSDLRQQLQESHERMEAATEKHRAQVSWFKGQMTSLQQDLVIAYKQQREQVESLRSGAEEYKSLYHGCLERNSSLEAQLQCFLALHGQLEENARKTAESCDAMTLVKDLIVKRKEQLQRDQEQLRCDREQLRCDQEQLQQKVACLAADQERLLKEKEEVSQKWKALTETEEKCRVLQTELQALQASRQQLEAEKREVENELSSLTSERAELVRELKKSESERQRLEVSVRSCEDQLYASNTMYEDTIAGLQERLQAAEKEESRLSKLCEDKGTHISSLEGDLSRASHWHRQMCEAQDQLQEVQAAAAETQTFHENEMTSLREECQEVRSKYKTLLRQARGYEAKLAQTRELCREAEQELDHTKTYAHLMLLQQNREMSDARRALDDVTAFLHGIQAELQARLPQHSQEDSLASHSSPEVNHVTESDVTEGDDSGGPQVESNSAPKSFLSSVIQVLAGDSNVTPNERDATPHECGTQGAEGNTQKTECHTQQAEGNTQREECREEGEGDGGADEKGRSVGASVMIGSSASAFTRVSNIGAKQCHQSHGLQDIPHKPDSQPNSQPNTECHTRHDSQSDIESRTQSNDACVNDSSLRDSEEPALSEHVRAMHTTLVSVARLFQALDDEYLKQEDDLAQQLTDLQGERKRDQDKMAALDSKHSQSVAACENQRREAELTEKRLREEIAELRAKLTAQHNDVERSRKFLEEQMQRMTSMSEQNSKLQHFEDSVRRLKRQVEEKATENGMLRERLEACIHGNAATSGDDARATYARENYLLRAEVNKMRFELIEARDETQELAAKANSRQRTLQHNLKSAEEEIVKLDDTVERLRQILLKHHKEARAWPELAHLWMEIIYDKRCDDPQMSWQSANQSQDTPPTS